VRALLAASLLGVCLMHAGCTTAGRQRPAFPWQRSSLDSLAKQAESADPDLRREAALELGRRRLKGQQAQRVTELLTALLRSDGAPLVRSAAAVSLGRLGGEANAAALSEGLTDSSAMVRADVYRGLGTTGAPTAVAPLARALAEEADVDARCAAARALGDFTDAEARQALLEALEADRRAVRTAAHQALLRSTGAKGVPPDRAAWEKWLAEQKEGSGAKRRRFFFW